MVEISLFTPKGELLGINFKSSIQSTLLYNPPKLQTAVVNDYFCPLLASTATAAATAADS